MKRTLRMSATCSCCVFLYLRFWNSSSRRLVHVSTAPLSGLVWLSTEKLAHWNSLARWDDSCALLLAFFILCAPQPQPRYFLFFSFPSFCCSYYVASVRCHTLLTLLYLLLLILQWSATYSFLFWLNKKHCETRLLAFARIFFTRNYQVDYPCQSKESLLI